MLFLHRSASYSWDTTSLPEAWPRLFSRPARLLRAGILKGFTRHAFPYTDLTKIDDLLKVPGFHRWRDKPSICAQARMVGLALRPAHRANEDQQQDSSSANHERQPDVPAGPQGHLQRRLQEPRRQRPDWRHGLHGLGAGRHHQPARRGGCPQQVPLVGAPLHAHRSGLRGGRVRRVAPQHRRRRDRQRRLHLRRQRARPRVARRDVSHARDPGQRRAR